MEEEVKRELIRSLRSEIEFLTRTLKELRSQPLTIDPESIGPEQFRLENLQIQKEFYYEKRCCLQRLLNVLRDTSSTENDPS